MNQLRPSGSFSILPPVIKNLIIINVLIFLLKLVLRNTFQIDLDQHLGLFYWESPYFRFWQPITHLFMHGGWSHLLLNMFALWMFGNSIENVLGQKKFLIFYFICGLGAALCQLLVYHYQLRELVELINIYPDKFGMYYSNPNSPLNTPMVGASGAIFGVLFAFGYLFPNLMVYIYFFIPMKAKYFVAIYAAIELFAGMKGSIGDNVAHFAHLGGMLFAFLLLYYWKKNRKLYL